MRQAWLSAWVVVACSGAVTGVFACGSRGPLLGPTDDGGSTPPLDAPGEDDAVAASDTSVDVGLPPREAGLDGALPVDAGYDAPQPPLDAGQEASADAPQDVSTDVPADSSPDTAMEASVCATPVTHTGSMAVTYQVDIAHDGIQPNDRLALPLCERWEHDLGELPAYALVAGGRVFVATAGNPWPAGATAHVTALDETTGQLLWGPIEIKGGLPWAEIAYDAGQVFAVNFDAELRAVDATTGSTNWAIPLPGQYESSSAPSASGGSVFVGAAGSGGTVYSVDEKTGNVSWTQGVWNGDDSSPALYGGSVFVSYVGQQTYGFQASTGNPLWWDKGPGEGGGGRTVAVYDNEVYTRDASGNLVLDTGSGAQTGNYASTFIPAFTGTTMLTTVGGVVNAIPLPVGIDAGGAATWSFGSAAEPVVIAPIVVGPHVVAGTSQRVVILSATDGSVVSSAALTGIPSPDEQDVRELVGLTAADGMLFVPSGTRLVAY